MHMSPLAKTDLMLDVDHDEVVPLQFRTLRSIMEAEPVLGLT
jgi:hypothetical protein